MPMTLLTIACVLAWLASERAGARANARALASIRAYRDARLAGMTVEEALNASEALS